ncbi:uncharacterized protein BJ212DRAFT_1304898 [Suillus subaureus]|uniref:Uncharacterized protein n=1 Tax=Suillus subaureus TaxID=48587 RepID=A0A9P7J4K3_9AGAM|nr:uncharacterized protein BJ212DRAFT_1304898 [Suillus subaureus]KAG1802318.1 hypothetical protein BJ212DRAFT_1304898 [Suillus subaureus]
MLPVLTLTLILILTLTLIVLTPILIGLVLILLVLILIHFYSSSVLVPHKEVCKIMSPISFAFMWAEEVVQDLGGIQSILHNISPYHIGNGEVVMESVDCQYMLEDSVPLEDYL